MPRAFATLILVSIVISSCTSLRDRGRVPTQQELVGSYGMGDGLGICEEIELRADGSFSGTNCAGEHIGYGSVAFNGTWSLSGAMISFRGAESQIGPAEAFFWHGKPAFVEVRYKQGDKVGPLLVFERQAKE